MTPVTHDELIGVALRWMARRGYGISLSEVGGRRSVWGEIPDAIGWCGTASMVIECKVSKSDFLADRDKPFRKQPHKGMGLHRYYLTPPGLVKKDELPPGWGLLEYPGQRVVQVVKAQQQLECCVRAELQLLVVALQRVQFRVREPLAQLTQYKYRKDATILPLDEEIVDKLELL